MDEKDIARKAVQILRAKLAPGWKLEAQPGTEGVRQSTISFRGPSGAVGSAIVEVRRSLTPREVLELASGVARQLRVKDGQTPVVVAAPYLSPRTRDVASEQELGYVDLTGNIRITLGSPGLLIETQGAQRDPTPRARPRRGLGGAAVGKVVRVLIDAKPPYGVMDIARAANVSPGYISRVLDVLDGEALIERSRRGPVEDVQWPELLRRRSENTDLFPLGATYSFVSPNGARRGLGSLRALGKLGEIIVGSNWAVTGSFASERFVQVAAPSLLAIYSTDPEVLGEKLSLLPADQGADVVIVRPPTSGVFAGVVPEEDGINWVAPSQAAIDCLSGTGRMPVEGEALIEWMVNNEQNWRDDSIPRLIERRQTFRWD